MKKILVFTNCGIERIYNWTKNKALVIAPPRNTRNEALTIFRYHITDESSTETPSSEIEFISKYYGYFSKLSYYAITQLNKNILLLGGTDKKIDFCGNINRRPAHYEIENTIYLNSEIYNIFSL